MYCNLNKKNLIYINYFIKILRIYSKITKNFEKNISSITTIRFIFIIILLKI